MIERFQRQGLTFDVRDGGPADGTPVVLLHGFPQDGTSYDLVVPRLWAAGLRTLVPDQRGYSPGARPRPVKAYRTQELVDDVLALLDEAGLASAHVVGHDWGAAVAWVMAGRHPERVRTLTALSTPHPRALLGSLRSSTQALRSWYMVAFQVPVLPELALAPAMVAVLTRSGLSPSSAEHAAARMREPQALRSAVNWYRALPASLRDPVPRCSVPTTYGHGRRDTFLGEAAANLTGDFVTGPYRLASLDAGHWLPESHPAEVASLILERVSSA
jgi:pimeloyl-ACP methyl ester carboxylesterase